MSITTLTSKGQITLPKAIRDRLALKQGDRFQVGIGRGGSLTLKRDQPAPIDGAYGLLRRLARRRKPASTSEMRAAVRQRATREHSALHTVKGPVMPSTDHGPLDHVAQPAVRTGSR